MPYSICINKNVKKVLDDDKIVTDEKLTDDKIKKQIEDKKIPRKFLIGLGRSGHRKHIRPHIALNTTKTEKMNTMWISQFLWAERYIPMVIVEKILPQLREGCTFIIGFTEWITAIQQSKYQNGIYVYAGYYEEIPFKIVKIKLTNTDRRKLMLPEK